MQPHAVRTSTLERVTNIGKPLSTTITGSLGFAIAGLQEEPPVDAVFYWT
jgi:hypothetical protein